MSNWVNQGKYINNDPFQNYVNNQDIIKKLNDIIGEKTFYTSNFRDLMEIVKNILNKGIPEEPIKIHKEYNQIPEIDATKPIVAAVQKKIKKTIKNYYNIPKWFFYNKTRKNTNKKTETLTHEAGVIVNNKNDIFFIYNKNANNENNTMLQSQNVRLNYFNTNIAEEYFDGYMNKMLNYRQTKQEHRDVILHDIQKYFLSVHDTLIAGGEKKENVEKIIVYFSKFKNKYEYMYLGELIYDNTIKINLMYYLLPLITNPRAIHFASKIIPESYTFENYKKYKKIIRVVFCTLLIEDNIIRYFTYDDIINGNSSDNITSYFSSPPKEYINRKIYNIKLKEIVDKILKQDCNGYTPIIEIKKNDNDTDYCDITFISDKCNT